MITQAVTVTAKGTQNIIIGRRGAYDTEQIVFDVSYLIEAYGEGTAILMVKRPQDSTAYPATTTQEDESVTWTVSETDTSYKGHGECELFWYVDDALAKSVIYDITILRDIGTTTEEAPDAYETWVDTLTELGATTLANATAAQEAQEAAETAQSAAEEAATAAEAAQASAEDAASEAATSEDNAETYSLKAEGYAVGTQDGSAVTSESEYYQNNAAYYANVAQQGAEESGYVWFAVDTSDGEMYVTITDNIAEDVSFAVNTTDGTLEVTVNG